MGFGKNKQQNVAASGRSSVLRYGPAWSWVEEKEQKGKIPHFWCPPLTVYCCCCLANVSLPGIGGTIPESKPFFYVNVADIESLEVEVSYVACEYGPLPSSPCVQTILSKETLDA